jgi:hypothetical protein
MGDTKILGLKTMTLVGWCARIGSEPTTAANDRLPAKPTLARIRWRNRLRGFDDLFEASLGDHDDLRRSPGPSRGHFFPAGVRSKADNPELPAVAMAHAQLRSDSVRRRSHNVRRRLFAPWSTSECLAILAFLRKRAMSGDQG